MPTTLVHSEESEECTADSEGHCQHWYDGEPCCRCRVLHAVTLNQGSPLEEEAWQRAQGAVCGDCRTGQPAIAPKGAFDAWTHPGGPGMVVDTVCGANAILLARFPDKHWQRRDQ